MGLTSTQLSVGGDIVSLTNPLPVTALPPATATVGTAAAIAAVDAAPDRLENIIWETGVLGQRVARIEYEAASIGLDYVETYTYVAGTDDIESIQRQSPIP